MSIDEKSARALICETGRELLAKGLVARTWGNVSCRADESSLLITPSGLDYTRTREEDIVLYDFVKGEAQGLHKPSSEKGVHAAAYELYDDVGFVIHTHQSCASAIGLAGFETLDISESEKALLGGIAKADYGLPGTKKLKNAVRAAMEKGAKTVFMVGHGALVCGSDKDDAMAKVELLEEICRRSLKVPNDMPEKADAEKKQVLMESLEAQFTYVEASCSDACVLWAALGKPLKAQLDDMAQMLGSKVNSAACDTDAVLTELSKRDGVFVKGVGAVVKADNADDAKALKILIDKAALCALHTGALGVRVALSPFDAALMRFVYKKKYSKQKGN